MPHRIPLGIYIHIPWCESKCPYCDFNSHTGDIQQEPYRLALIRDLEESLRLHPHLNNSPIHSIFIGGGTPSLLDGKFYASILRHLASRFNLSANTEITLETNPGSAEAKRFDDYIACGINRLSIGAQSFEDKMLTRLGRIHNRQQIFTAYDAARTAGFKRINLDLMFGLPGQSLRQAMHDLRTAVQLDSEHISWYQLTREPGTPFYSAAPPNMPDEDLLVEMEEAGREILAEHKFSRYEISAYSQNARAGTGKDGGQCRHNLNYWQFGDYLGLGAGAHSKLTLPDGDILRIWRKRGPQDYIDSALKRQNKQNSKSEAPSSFWGGSRRLRQEDKISEFMLNALRLVRGFDSKLFEERTGISLQHLAEPTDRAVALGLLAKHKHSFAPTKRGLRMLNDLLLLFMPEDESARLRLA